MEMEAVEEMEDLVETEAMEETVDLEVLVVWEVWEALVVWEVDMDPGMDQVTDQDSALAMDLGLGLVLDQGMDQDSDLVLYQCQLPCQYLSHPLLLKSLLNLSSLESRFLATQ